ncbi:MAG TPA: hypothetical protein VNT01_16230 [Symbiobacteriaceae bacterium]|nr:hypothetical protein [Symbiobacteriaceae bacterium]
MFFHRRRHHHSLLHLILLLLGFKAVGRCCRNADPAKQEEFKAKGRLFRSKLKDAFAVWEPEAKQEGGEATAEQQG